MKKKIFLTYIINAVISVFYIIKGLFTVISVNIRNSKADSVTLQKITSAEFLNNFREIISFLENAMDKVQTVINIVKLYVYGYPSLFVGLFAFSMSSIGVFLLTKKQTKTTVGYYVTVVYSYVLLGLLTLVYFIISGIIADIKK